FARFRSERRRRRRSANTHRIPRRVPVASATQVGSLEEPPAAPPPPGETSPRRRRGARLFAPVGGRGGEAARDSGCSTTRGISAPRRHHRAYTSYIRTAAPS